MLGNGGDDRLARLGSDFFRKITIKIDMSYDVNEVAF